MARSISVSCQRRFAGESGSNKSCRTAVSISESSMVISFQPLLALAHIAQPPNRLLSERLGACIVGPALAAGLWWASFCGWPVVGQFLRLACGRASFCGWPGYGQPAGYGRDASHHVAISEERDSTGAAVGLDVDAALAVDGQQAPAVEVARRALVVPDGQRLAQVAPVRRQIDVRGRSRC